jgi:hypothetical protein
VEFVFGGRGSQIEFLFFSILKMTEKRRGSNEEGSIEMIVLGIGNQRDMEKVKRSSDNALEL